MARTNSQPYWTDVDNSGNDNNQFDRLGPPAKYYDPIVWTTGQLDLTGSNFGYGAYMVSASAIVDLKAELTYFGGASTTIASLTTGTIHDIAVSKVSGSTLSGGGVYLFRRQQ